MTAAATRTSFLDTALARLISLVLAGLIAWLIHAQWGPQIAALFEEAKAPLPAAMAPVSEANPALDACLAQRVGDVDRMKSEGVIDDARYASFRARAEELCRAQNPPG